MDRRQLRFFLFGIAILVGIVAGIFLGWEIIPPRDAKPEPQTLQTDYKTDFVLMVSELYHQDGDLDTALSRLAYLGKSPPAEIMLSAIQFADKNTYSTSDIQLMLKLFSSIQNLSMGDLRIG